MIYTKNVLSLFFANLLL